MNKTRIIYWASTAIVSLMMLFTGFSYLTNEEMKQAFVQIGFPSFFRIELAVAKLVGGVLLLVPAVKGFAKQFVYVGFMIVLASAFLTHLAIGDTVSHSIMPLLFLGILIVSYVYYGKLAKPVTV
ncbi:DoxX family protein [Chitinophaga lutea]|uniref:DoxX family protein n=1 Tax=Chitinophaga lutea TaxID=2488634 RepID=A0A3N4PBK5_9BACT|nr:DoxX family protein [Chitinophaga lutea]RPE05475.1 DoxX family protein [Chitinophaga lutea]